MRALLRHRTTLIVFAVSVCAGGLQFIGQALLARRLPIEDFSRVSFVLSQFSTYLLLVELGIQGEVIRRMSFEPQDFPTVPIFILRLCGAFVGYIVMILQGVFAKVSYETFVSLCIFGLTLFPAVALLQVEAFGFAQNKPLLSTALRLSRLLGLAAYLIVVVWQPEQCFSFLWAFPIIFLLMVVVLYKQYPIGVGKLRNFTELKNSSLKYALEVWSFCLGTGFWWVFNALFALLCLRTLGDKNLSSLTIGQTLTIPIALLAQAVSNSWISKQAKSGSLKLSLTNQLQFAGVVVIFILIFCFEPLLHQIFPHTPAKDIRVYFIPFALSQIIIAIIGFKQIAMFAQGDRKIGTVLPLISLCCLLLGGIFVTASTLAILHFLCYGFCLVYIVCASKFRDNRQIKS